MALTIDSAGRRVFQTCPVVCGEIFGSKKRPGDPQLNGGEYDRMPDAYVEINVGSYDGLSHRSCGRLSRSLRALGGRLAASGSSRKEAVQSRVHLVQVRQARGRRHDRRCGWKHSARFLSPVRDCCQVRQVGLQAAHTLNVFLTGLLRSWFRRVACVILRLRGRDGRRGVLLLGR
jgi:hypothetical protein